MTELGHYLCEFFGEWNEALHALCRQLWIVAVEADEGGLRELCSHALEGKTDNDGGVEAYAKFQKQQSLGAGLLDEFLIAVCLLVPMGILYKGVIAAEVH